MKVPQHILDVRHDLEVVESSIAALQAEIDSWMPQRHALKSLLLKWENPSPVAVTPSKPRARTKAVLQREDSIVALMQKLAVAVTPNDIARELGISRRDAQRALATSDSFVKDENGNWRLAESAVMAGDAVYSELANNSEVEYVHMQSGSV